jgi:phosphate transport system protein
VLDDDSRMDALEVEIDRRVLEVLALHRPVATDLRAVLTTSRAITDLERIGDLAGVIARVSLALSPEVGLQPGPAIKQMGQEVADGLTELREGWHRDDVTVLGRVRESKARVGELQVQVRSGWLQNLKEHPDQAHRVWSITELAAALVRIADHTENLAEQAVYRVEGKDVRHAGLRAT